ncbi:MAG: NAD(P)/FAD-dependent oxidoreductase [Chlorobiaceae bacterium]|nr:NAD(P)/FAD-dependent oxidoreductase [Chlorobiaceae bacterium]
MEIDVVIIGAGVVGLACAAESAKRGYSTLIVERHESFGQDTSSRNSEVIHSGIYYPPGSLKARLCVEANHNIYNECDRAGVWTRKCGKLIVAIVAEEQDQLEILYRRGIENGVEGLQLLTQSMANKIEPEIKCFSAIYLPSTGIIDSHQLMKSYIVEAKENGAEIGFGIEFVGGERKKGQYKLHMKDTNGEVVEIESKYVINSGGLFADKVAERFGIDIDKAEYRLHHNRGHYYSVSGLKNNIISHLIYPLPHAHLVSIGIHMTIDRSGRMKLGPDMEYLYDSIPESEWYKFDDSRREKFFNSVHRYFPSLKLDDLSPDQVGVRPKRKGSEDNIKDFIINEESEKGLPGLVNLIGIESPGLTCSREIAREVFKILNN